MILERKNMKQLCFDLLGWGCDGGVLGELAFLADLLTTETGGVLFFDEEAANQRSKDVQGFLSRNDGKILADSLIPWINDCFVVFFSVCAGGLNQDCLHVFCYHCTMIISAFIAIDPYCIPTLRIQLNDYSISASHSPGLQVPSEKVCFGWF